MASPAHQRPLRILVADGDALARRIAARVLEGEGHAVALAADSDAALDLLKAHGFDLMLVGLDLPGLGGIETAKLYRFMALGRPRMPILALATGWTLDASTRAGEAGIEQFVPKPLIPAELIAAVASVAPPTQPARAEIDDPFGVVTPLFGRDTGPARAVDPTLLDRMEALGGVSFVAELIGEFASSSEAALAALDASLARRSIAGMRVAGAQLEELAPTMGADTLRRMGAALKQVSPPEYDRRGRDYVAQVRAEYARVLAELKGRASAPAQARG